MKGLAAQLGLMLLATVVAGVCCALGDVALTRGRNLTAVVAGGLSSVPGSLAAIVACRIMGPTTSLILVNTFLRPALSLAVGCGLAALYPRFWNSPFFITLGVAYLANLGLETWTVFEEFRRHDQLPRSAA